MANTSSFPPLVSLKTPVPIILAGSIVTLGPYWRNCITSYVDPLVKRLSEENYSHPLARRKLVAYSQVHPALIDPVYAVVEHDEEGIMEDSPDIAALCGYMSVIKFIDDLQARHPNEEFSFFLWHVVAGQHGSWDRNWEFVCGELMKRDVNLSVVLLDDCPVFVQLFSAISPPSSRIKPWFHTFPDHRVLLSGFMPPGELGGAMPSLVSTVHPAPLISVPSTTIGVTAWNCPSELPAHGTPYPDDQWAAPRFSQHAGSDAYAPIPAIVPSLDDYEGPQAASLAAVQSQPPLNLNNIPVPEAQGLAPMDCPTPPNSSGVEQQQPTPHNYTEEIDSRDDFANANARPISSGSSDEISDNKWFGTLNLDGMRVPVRALMADAAGNPKLSALTNELEVELAAVGLKLSILAIQVWIRKNKAPIVRLSYVDGTDNHDFDQLVEKIRVRGYAIVKWGNRDRLLLAPLGKALLCAAFPEKGTPKRPTPQQPRKVRTVTRKENPQKEESSQKKQTQKSRQRPGPYPVTKSKSSNGPCHGPYPEAAAQSAKPLQRSQPELPQMPYYPPVAMEPMQGEINPSSQLYQMDGSAQCQMISPQQFQGEQHAYLQAPRRVLGAHGEQLVHRWMGTAAAGYIADPMEVAEIYECVNFDGCAV